MTYNLLKFVHVVSVIVWVGGMVMLILLNRRLAHANDAAAMRAVGQQGGALSMVLFMPAAIVAVLTGVGMVLVGDLSFGAPWISWGFLATILSFVIGGALAGGGARKLQKQIASGQADPAMIAAAQKRIMMFAWLNLLLLLSVVWAMVFKP